MSRTFLSIVSSFFIAALLLSPRPTTAQDENHTAISDWLLHSDTENALYHYLANEGLAHLDEREQTIAKLETQADWENRQAHVRRVLRETVGPFPEKTPLNVEITRTVKKDGYAVEHLIYHSQPNFPATASLFVPENLEGEAPGILFCTGHSSASYDRPLYQNVILNLVKKGFVVLAFDPVSQGERLQYLDPATGESILEGSAHGYSGAQAFIAGGSQARHAIWDGIRGIDYLLTREDVDPDRIGVHGLSGGGTQAAYIGAFDDRVQAMSSSNYPIGYTRMLESIGPQDAEQNFYHGLARGLDHADFFEVRAPKPSMIIATTRDYFSIQGARETHAEARKAYAAFGASENMEIVEDDYEHGYTEKTREGINDFFQRHLDHPGTPEDLDHEHLTTEEMRVTSTGQVQTSEFKGETIFTVNRNEAREKLTELNESRQSLSGHLPRAIASARNLSGYRTPGDTADPVFRGRYQRDGYIVEKYFIEGEGDYAIPYLLMIPNEGSTGKALLYLNPDGKSAEAGPGSAMEQYVREGYVVLAPDLIGTGEMGPGDAGWTYDGVPYQYWFTAVLNGRSIAGLRAGDITRLAGTLQTDADIHAQHISAVAHGTLSPALLHAAAFTASISNVALVEPLISYRSLVTTEMYRPEYIIGAVAGALPAYDLPDLAATLAPGQLMIVDPRNGASESAGEELIREEYSIVRRAYDRTNASNAFIVHESPNRPVAEVIASWLE
jgi:dienelactone hydrolase